ncbi:hypothetical protein MIND_01300100 [Mycena indigotica]|uniref:Uncharacterized protein n=1 Tax=Mycena indigotica TaxID=2126181 RepID=A0A8H6S0B3_9AGAR|nr:uncharacterized protein MIND_01300100 [Mycena indigotica]KAF7290599.1 hypothetical protein MIND_01300100 [Mycena indigotica]
MSRSTPESLNASASSVVAEMPKGHSYMARLSKKAPTLQDISMQLFALSYNVSKLLDMPPEGIDEDSEVWKFLDEVLECLPKSLKENDIIDSRLALYRVLSLTERERPISLTEHVNPGADLPPPLSLEGKDEEGNIHALEIPIEAVVDGNSYIGDKPFELQHNAMAFSREVEYIVEFVPDEVPEDVNAEEWNGIELEPDTEVQIPSLQKNESGRKKRKGKGKGKAKAVEEQSGSNTTRHRTSAVPQERAIAPDSKPAEPSISKAGKRKRKAQSTDTDTKLAPIETRSRKRARR